MLKKKRNRWIILHEHKCRKHILIPLGHEYFWLRNLYMYMLRAPRSIQWLMSRLNMSLLDTIVYMQVRDDIFHYDDKTCTWKVTKVLDMEVTTGKSKH